MKIEMRAIESVLPYERNLRVNDKAVDAVAASIREFGFRQPIVVDEAGVIVVGHTRLLAAKKLWLKEVPVHVATGLTPAQVRAYRIADNKLHELSTWDLDLLPLELKNLQAMDVDLELLGFGAEELEILLGAEFHGNLGLTDPDAVPEPPGEAVTQPGDLIELGQHRLLCGDSTRPKDVERLMGGQKAGMMFTDPPWNVAIGLDSNPKHRQREGLVNDDLPPERFEAFLSDFVYATRSHIAGDVYCVMGAAEWPRLDAVLRRHGYHWSATVIWVKDAFVLGRSKYHRRYEPIWYGWHEDGRSSFVERRDLDDVWEIPRPKRSDEHPTMKPVELPLRAISNSSGPGDIVLDPFGGSGSTLIAAERTGRRAHLIEIDPRYCDTIVRRWEEYTGKKAQRVAQEVRA